MAALGARLVRVPADERESAAARRGRRDRRDADPALRPPRRHRRPGHRGRRDPRRPRRAWSRSSCPIGGGGLISGIAAALRGLRGAGDRRRAGPRGRRRGEQARRRAAAVAPRAGGPHGRRRAALHRAGRADLAARARPGRRRRHRRRGRHRRRHPAGCTPSACPARPAGPSRPRDGSPCLPTTAPGARSRWSAAATSTPPGWPGSSDPTAGPCRRSGEARDRRTRRTHLSTRRPSCRVTSAPWSRTM